MVHRSVGVEAYARYKQYEYRPNSRLVLTSEPIVDPDLLWGKIDCPELDDKIEKSKRDPPSEPALNKRRLQEEGVYQPRTKETRAAYEAMLGVIQHQLGGHPLKTASAAADEILAVIKNEAFKTPNKKKEVEKLLLNDIDSNVFDQLVEIANVITDYRCGGDAADPTDNCDDDSGVAVESDEDDERAKDQDEDNAASLGVPKV